MRYAKTLYTKCREGSLLNEIEGLWWNHKRSYMKQEIGTISL